MSMLRTKKIGKRGLLAIGLIVAVASLVTAGVVMTLIMTSTTQVTTTAKDIRFARSHSDENTPAVGDYGDWETIPATFTSETVSKIGGEMVKIHFKIDNKCGQTATFDVTDITVPPGYTLEIRDNANAPISGTAFVVPNNTIGHYYYVLTLDPWIETGSDTITIEVPVPTLS